LLSVSLRKWFDAFPDEILKGYEKEGRQTMKKGSSEGREGRREGGRKKKMEHGGRQEGYGGRNKGGKQMKE
jgi:hypothetical protein